MPLLITKEQNADLVEFGLGGMPLKLHQILVANHTRVLDFFRDVDTNFDGCISKGEMSFALQRLGVYASPKEIAQLFVTLDPDGNGVVEFAELQQALQDAAHGIQRASTMKKPRPLTQRQQVLMKEENRFVSNEYIEMVYEFERHCGVGDPEDPPPPSAEGLRATERQERLQAEARRMRANKASAPVPRGDMMSRLDACCVKPTLLRPQTAPARLSRDAKAAQRKAETYQYWLDKHRGEIESHATVVQKEYEDEARMRQQRVSARREKQLQRMRIKQAESKANALERLEPFPMRREMDVYTTTAHARQRERAWAQPIVFLPHNVARRDPAVRRERSAPDHRLAIESVLNLPPC